MLLHLEGESFPTKKEKKSGFKRYISPLHNYRVAKYELNNGVVHYCIEFKKVVPLETEKEATEGWNTLANKAGSELKLNTFEDAEEKIEEYVKSDMQIFQTLIKTKTIL